MPPSGSPPTADLYRLLDVSPTATTAEIEAAWRSAIRRAHPDVSQGPGATAAAARLNLARDWLTDPDGRAAYDRSRRPETSRVPGAGAGSAGAFRAPGARDASGEGRWADERWRGRGGRIEAASGSSLAGVVGLLGIMAFFVALTAGITETAAGVVALLASVVAIGAALILALRGPASPGR
jgi:curved DNA-binding protein CbpA